MTTLKVLTWTHVNAISDSRILVSVYHCCDIAANLAVFDVSRKGQAKKIYSFEEVSGGKVIAEFPFIIIYFLVTGHGDVTYNSRKSILGAIPVGGKIAYHLYNFSAGKTENTVQLLRKSKWHSQYSTAEGNYKMIPIADSFNAFESR